MHTEADSAVGNGSASRAVVLGATGATGRQVVKCLLRRGWNVTAISRRHFEYFESETPPLELHLKDAVFNCLGTTRGQAGSAEAFVDVEVGLTEHVSSVAKEAGVGHMSVVSAQGANKDVWAVSWIHPLLYTRTLGEKEEAVKSKQFLSVSIFQPGMLERLVGDRTAENIITWLLPSVALKVDALALAMVKDAEARLKHIKEKNMQCSSEGAQSAGSVPISPMVHYISGNGNIRAMAAASNGDQLA